METKKPLDSVGWLGGSSHRTVINEAARREASMKPWSEHTSCYVCGHSIEEHAGHECTECNCICFEPEPEEDDE